MSSINYLKNVIPYTNFSIEVIEQPFIGEPALGRRVTTIFTRNADLINKMYVKIVLNSVYPAGNNFAWVRRVGHAILDEIEIEIGGTIVDRHYGTWLDIWYELARKGDHERGYDNMIGDIPELTTYDTSIKEQYTLFVPLQFWFNRHIGLSIPLVALQYHDVRIHIQFNTIENLIVRDSNFDTTLISIDDATILTNYVYLDSEERRRFAQVGHEYLIEQIQFNGVEPVENLVQRYTLDYNHPTKEIIWAMKHGNYTTGKRFIYYTNANDWTSKPDENTLSPIEEGACKIILESVSVGTQPTNGTWTEISGTSTGTVGTINVTNNSNQLVYVNGTSLSIGMEPTYGITDKINADVVIDQDGTVTCNSVVTSLTVRDFSIPHEFITDTRNNPIDPLVVQFSNYGILIDGSVNPISTGLIKLNGHDRFDEREGAYFNYVQPHQHHSNTPKDGINVYSFALFPEEHQPSGTANLSRIDDTELILNFLESTTLTELPDLGFLNEDNAKE
jgi:hypothetical protein